MPVYNVVLNWGQAYRGVGEVYVTPNFASGTQAVNNIQQMLVLRAAMLQTSVYFPGVRIGIQGKNRNSKFYRPPFSWFPDAGGVIQIPANGTFSQGLQQNKPSVTLDALQEDFSFSGDRHSLHYIAGIPQGVIAAEPATFNSTACPEWQSARVNWEQYLVTQKWQVRAINKEANLPLKVINVTVQGAAPALLGIVVQTTTAPALVQGSKLSLQGFRPAKGTRNPTLNGTWYVNSLDVSQAATQTIVYLRGSAGIDPNAQRFTDKTTLTPVTYTNYPIDQISAIQVVTHKRGKPAGGSRGRRLTRPSLDP